MKAVARESGNRKKYDDSAPFASALFFLFALKKREKQFEKKKKISLGKWND